MGQVFETACGHLSTAIGFQRKRWLQRLRFACSRLIYLAPASELPRIEQALETIPEVIEYAAIFRALHTRDLGPLLLYGSRVAQAAAQPLKALRETIRCTPMDADWQAASVEALSVLLMNGVKLDLGAASPLPKKPILNFARGSLEGSSDGSTSAEYFGELSNLHGRPIPARHAEMLATAFDVDECMVFDGELLRNYS